jgi:hypothetical protein
MKRILPESEASRRAKPARDAVVAAARLLAVFLAAAFASVGFAADPLGPDSACPIIWASSWATIKSDAYYPRVAALGDGTLLAGYDHTVGSQNAIGVVRSTNGGASWSAGTEAVLAPLSDDLANAFPLQIADGTVLMACRHNSPSAGIYRIEVHASQDLGATWQLRSTPATGSVGLWEPLLFQLPDGTVQVYYASEEGIAPDQRIQMRASADGGMTWGGPVTVARKAGSRDGMPGVVRLPDGTLLAVFEASDLAPYRFVIRAVRSTDDGRTWSASRQLVHAPANPVSARWAAGAPSVVRCRDGSLLVSFQADDDVAYAQGNPASDPAMPAYNYLDNARFKYVASSNGGQTWTAAATLAGYPTVPALWGALVAPPSGDVLALTGFGGAVRSRRGTVPLASVGDFEIYGEKGTDQHPRR